MESLATTKSQSWLVWFLRGSLVLGFLVLFGRIADLQIIRGDYFRSLSETNRTRRIPIIAPRGNILARGGEVLVGNKEVKRKLVFNEGSGYTKEAADENSRGEDIITEWTRDYKLGEDFAHISGYVGEVNEEELGKIRGKCPDKGPRKLGAVVGRTGLEEEYECLLSGIDGEELVEVDAKGDKVRILGKREPVPGSNVVTNIDYALQQKVARELSGKKGAVIATDKNGSVLALFSSPSYDPNILTDPQKSSEKIGILNNKDLPLFNRVTGGLFHPGSVFKPVVGISALEEGKITKDYEFDDTGQITIDSIYGNFSFKNWYFTQYGGSEGRIGLARAIARSTDTFFYKIGELTGMENLNKWTDKFRLDEKTGIDIPGEIAGLVPSPEWKLKVKGERWFLGNTYHFSIGQGDLALTPAEVNRVTATIANTGRICVPRIIKDSAGKDLTECEELQIKSENLQLIKEGMKGACSPGGTAYTFFDFTEKTGIEIFCKTGTAQNPSEDPHAWFTVFSEQGKTSGIDEIVLTVLVENGGEGSKVAGPIAREIFNSYYRVPVTPTPSPANEGT